MEIAASPKSKSSRLTLYIVLAMILGIVVGYFINKNTSAEFIASFAPKIKLLATIFLRLVQMIIAPLVFATLVVGIAKLGDLKTVGRVGGKAMLWFVSASLISLLLGLILVNITKPGVG
ncbi:MAG: cation:dicarboxylase symporter family transporter, partial [Ferruginibacter sp.]